MLINSGIFKSLIKIFKINRTIYGFHFIGNYGYIDDLGFLIVSKSDLKNLSDSTIK
jgi:hypothetical protein